MLKNIHPLLTPELLYVLRAMGHGDELVLADCNFPSDSIATQTAYGNLIRLDGSTLPEVAEAVLSVLPLDSFVEYPMLHMEVVGQPTEVLAVHEEVQTIVAQNSDRPWAMGSLERHAFYNRARRAYAVVGTGERRGYGCFIFTKGVIAPDGSVV